MKVKLPTAFQAETEPFTYQMVGNMRVNLRMVNLMEKENDYTQNVAQLKERIKIIKPMDKEHTLI